MMYKDQPKRPCAWCERVFKPLSQSGKYCTLGCRDAALRKRQGIGKPLPERACRECGTVFVPKHHLTKICSDECRTKVSRRKSMRTYYRTRIVAKPRTRECLICGTTFEARGHYLRSLTCKPECSYLLSRKRTKDAMTQAMATDIDVIRELGRQYKAAHSERKKQGTLRPKPQNCKVCAGPIVGARMHTTVCSLQCAGKARTDRKGRYT